ncbi:hypothetical protein AB0M54_19355 [Actinoplanes sp. NPDC051470]|uniref:hypothetical protein n=1 Tax=Actinoplanes sp. NPDC051470 TaxID=3157224 RepID=UPI0034146CCA
MFLTIAIRDIAAPVVVPVAQAPIEYALITNRPRFFRAGKIIVVYAARFRCTDRSSARLRTQLNGRPDDPDDSSTTLPTTSISPPRQRRCSGYLTTYPCLSVGGKSLRASRFRALEPTKSA